MVRDGKGVLIERRKKNKRKGEIEMECAKAERDGTAATIFFFRLRIIDLSQKSYTVRDYC